MFQDRRRTFSCPGSETSTTAVAPARFIDQLEYPRNQWYQHFDVVQYEQVRSSDTTPLDNWRSRSAFELSTTHRNNVPRTSLQPLSSLDECEEQRSSPPSLAISRSTPVTTVSSMEHPSPSLSRPRPAAALQAADNDKPIQLTGAKAKHLPFTPSVLLSSQPGLKADSVTAESSRGTSRANPSSEVKESTKAPPVRRTKPKSHAKKKKEGHIPRPQNCWVLFRRHAFANNLVPKDRGVIDAAELSRIIGHMWNCLPEDEKEEWREEARRQAAEHKQMYPNYRYQPDQSAKQNKVKRNVKRADDAEERCFKIANEILQSYGRECAPPKSKKKPVTESKDGSKSATKEKIVKKPVTQGKRSKKKTCSPTNNARRTKANVKVETCTPEKHAARKPRAPRAPKKAKTVDSISEPNGPSPVNAPGHTRKKASTDTLPTPMPPSRRRSTSTPTPVATSTMMDDKITMYPNVNYGQHKVPYSTYPPPDLFTSWQAHVGHAAGVATRDNLFCSPLTQPLPFARAFSTVHTTVAVPQTCVTASSGRRRPEPLNLSQSNTDALSMLCPRNFSTDLPPPPPLPNLLSADTNASASSPTNAEPSSGHALRRGFFHFNENAMLVSPMGGISFHTHSRHEAACKSCPDRLSGQSQMEANFLMPQTESRMSISSCSTFPPTPGNTRQWPDPTRLDDDEVMSLDPHVKVTNTPMSVDPTARELDVHASGFPPTPGALTFVDMGHRCAPQLDESMGAMLPLSALLETDCLTDQQELALRNHPTQPAAFPEPGDRSLLSLDKQSSNVGFSDRHVRNPQTDVHMSFAHDGTHGTSSLVQQSG